MRKPQIRTGDQSYPILDITVGRRMIEVDDVKEEFIVFIKVFLKTSRGMRTEYNYNESSIDIDCYDTLKVYKTKYESLEGKRYNLGKFYKPRLPIGDLTLVSIREHRLVGSTSYNYRIGSIRTIYNSNRIIVNVSINDKLYQNLGFESLFEDDVIKKRRYGTIKNEYDQHMQMSSISLMGILINGIKEKLEIKDDEQDKNKEV